MVVIDISTLISALLYRCAEPVDCSISYLALFVREVGKLHLGYIVSLQARSCIEMGFSSSIDQIQFFVTYERQFVPIMSPQRLRDIKSGIIVGDREVILTFQSPSRGMVRCCLKHKNSCATALGEHFPSTMDYPPLLASSSLGYVNVLRSHLSVHRLERFMGVRLGLWRLHLRYIHYPLARLSQLGISWQLRGLLRLLCAGCLVGREYFGTIINAREFPLHNYLVC